MAFRPNDGGRSTPGHTVRSCPARRDSIAVMLPFTWDTLRLFVHILAATIWVGGQITLGILVPTLRAAGAGAPKAAARRFDQIAWPAFAVLVVTGVWNVVAESDKQSHPGYQATLGVKLVLVLLSGVAAFLHTRARSKAGLAVWGGIGGLTGLGAVLFGVVLAG